MLQGFKEFITRGNAIDLAVGVIIGGAFAPIVAAVTAVLMGIIGGLFGQPNFDQVGSFMVNDAEILPGAIVTAILIAVLFTILLVTANTMAQSFRERTSELAVLKTIGMAQNMMRMPRCAPASCWTAPLT